MNGIVDQQTNVPICESSVVPTPLPVPAQTPPGPLAHSLTHIMHVSCSCVIPYQLSIQYFKTSCTIGMICGVIQATLVRGTKSSQNFLLNCFLSCSTNVQQIRRTILNKAAICYHIQNITCFFLVTAYCFYYVHDQSMFELTCRFHLSVFNLFSNLVLISLLRLKILL